MDEDKKELSPADPDERRSRGVRWFFRELGHFYADCFRAAAGLVILFFAILVKPFLAADDKRDGGQERDPEQ